MVARYINLCDLEHNHLSVISHSIVCIVLTAVTTSKWELLEDQEETSASPQDADIDDVDGALVLFPYQVSPSNKVSGRSRAFKCLK